MDPDPFYHQAKIVRKTLILMVLFCDFFLTFFNRQKNFLKQKFVYVGVLKVHYESSRIRIH